MVPGNSVLAKAGAKIPLTAKYSGSSRPEEFEVYVASLLRWMRVNCLLGVDSTQDQLAILGMTLEGPAQEWFVQNIERGGRSTRGWTLVTAIKRLHDRFLPTATKHEVAYKFDRVRQHGRTVHDFVNELLKLSQRLAYPPDDYTFRRRFVDGLDDEIAGEITKRGYMAENTTARDLYRAANDVEQALSYQRSAAGRKARLHHLAQGNSSSLMRQAQVNNLRLKNRGPIVPSKNPQASTSRPVQNAPYRPSAPRPTVPGRPVNNVAPQCNNRTPIKCFECGQTGHLRPNCPKLRQV